MVKTAANPGGLPKESLTTSGAARRQSFANFIAIFRRVLLWLQPARRQSLGGHHPELVRQGMMGAPRRITTALSPSHRPISTADLKKISVARAGDAWRRRSNRSLCRRRPLSAKLLKNGTLKTIRLSAWHAHTEAATINAICRVLKRITQFHLGDESHACSAQPAWSGGLLARMPARRRCRNRARVGAARPDNGTPSCAKSCRHFFDFSAIESQLADYDACFFCLGVSSVGMDEARYRHLTYDITMAAATTLGKTQSGYGVHLCHRPQHRSTNAAADVGAIKGKTENDLLKLRSGGLYVSPAASSPLHASGRRPRGVQAIYSWPRRYCLTSIASREIHDPHRSNSAAP